MASPSEIPPDGLLGGKLRLLERIGRGGMGDVWMARNEATHAEVAVKTLQRSERSENHDARFRREARLAATISHRNVVRIFDLIDEEDGTLGLVMELLRGGTLEACIRERKTLGTLQAIAVAVPILSALHHVHEKGIVHRDVKPSNIFFAVEPDGHVIPKILDFGIAKLPAASSPLTVDGSVLGTPHYMSPEQIRGQEDLDGRSDMFSLAALVYEMLTGERVFQRDSAAGSLAAVLEHQVDPDPRIEPRVWIAIARALAKRPYERFASCAEFAEALRRAAEASDEDLSAALQELRPSDDALLGAEPESRADARSVPGTSGSSRTPGGSRSGTRSRSRASSAPGGTRNVAWGLAAVGVVALLAVTVTLAVTHSGATPARADENVVAAGRTAPDPGPGPGTANAPAGSTVGAVGAVGAAGEGSAGPVTLPPASMTPTPLAVASPAKTTSGGGGRGSGRSPAVTTTSSPPASAAGSVAKGPKKPIATSPGF